MKYIAIVFLYIIGSSISASALRLHTDKLTGEESVSAEADLDALMDKYDEKEKGAKDSKDKKHAEKPFDPN